MALFTMFEIEIGKFTANVYPLGDDDMCDVPAWQTQMTEMAKEAFIEQGVLPPFVHALCAKGDERALIILSMGDSKADDPMLARVLKHLGAYALVLSVEAWVLEVATAEEIARYEVSGISEVENRTESLVFTCEARGQVPTMIMYPILRPTDPQGEPTLGPALSIKGNFKPMLPAPPVWVAPMAHA